ncbi:GyrI-like domain-containing protein [Paenibacillus mesophilus]|uniref:GyrI-like domain-containing protein n=1 Tax=Paenibacillus mesophilus TaxID=2582849 RepID=UPI00110ED872|nr:GyrI-like domain-containing protein [Paenibacillus mesophilus]TMV52274.1 GyrI-like domain-containing protein [Paenibacillus mesophilus]
MGERVSNNCRMHDNYKPSAIPGTLRLIHHESAKVDEVPINGLSYPTIQLNDMMLIGVKLQEPFPGFARKAEYLADGWSRLIRLLDGMLVTDTPATYFVYHGSEANLSLCVQMDDLRAIPNGSVKIPVPGRTYAVVPYKDSLQDQEKMFVEVCRADFEMDQDAIRFELYDVPLVPFATQQCELKSFFPLPIEDRVRLRP